MRRPWPIAAVILQLICFASTAAPPVGAQTLNDDALRNASYLFPTTTDWWVRLTDGEYSETDEHGSTLRLWLEDIERGDLDGDGVVEAAVILVWNGGGSGTFLSLALVENWHGIPVHRATIRLTDASEVLSLEIEDRTITARLLEPPRPTPASFTDPEQTRVYELRNGMLVEVTRQATSGAGG
jgi:hypothetical protein